MDEIGVPFGITIDFDTVGFERPRDGCVTVREREQHARGGVGAAEAKVAKLEAERKERMAAEQKAAEQAAEDERRIAEKAAEIMLSES